MATFLITFYFAAKAGIAFNLFNLIDLLWFPARRCDISGTLVVPVVVFVVLDSLLGVPIALFI